jgi:hypothetical protein
MWGPQPILYAEHKLCKNTYSTGGAWAYSNRVINGGFAAVCVQQY